MTYQTKEHWQMHERIVSRLALCFVHVYEQAMGATVSAISTSPQKEADAKSMGASSFLLSTDTEAMSKAANSFNLILDTVSAGHEVMPYIGALKTNGTLPS